MEMGDVLKEVKVDLTDKFGDKECDGYTWEINDDARNSNVYTLQIARINNPGEYFSVLTDIVYKDFHPFGLSTEQAIEFKIARYISGIDEFRLDERIEENLQKLRRNKRNRWISLFQKYLYFLPRFWHKK